jgi:bacterioferritin-associated ferredoxin
MYVCVCNSVTDKQIRKCVEQGACSIEHLSDELNVATCCGKCKSCAKRVLREAMKDITATVNTVPVDLVPAYHQV